MGEPCRPTMSGVGHAILGRLTLLHDWLVNRVPLNTSKLRVLVIAGEDTYFGVVRDEVRGSGRGAAKISVRHRSPPPPPPGPGLV